MIKSGYREIVEAVRFDNYNPSRDIKDLENWLDTLDEGSSNQSFVISKEVTRVIEIAEVFKKENYSIARFNLNKHCYNYIFRKGTTYIGLWEFDETSYLMRVIYGDGEDKVM